MSTQNGRSQLQSLQPSLLPSPQPAEHRGCAGNPAEMGPAWECVALAAGLSQVRTERCPGTVTAGDSHFAAIIACAGTNLRIPGKLSLNYGKMQWYSLLIAVVIYNFT